MNRAILVDEGYFHMLESLHEDIHQARVNESAAIAKRYLLAGMTTAEEITRWKLEGEA